MATLEGRFKLDTGITMVLSYEEAGALEALAGYGVEPFLKCFYKEMGEAYLKPYESGLRSLFTSVYGGNSSPSVFLKRSKEARQVMLGTHKVVKVEEES